MVKYPMAYTLITTDSGLEKLRKQLQSSGITTIAVDFEGEFNLHCYGEHLCLIQVFDGKEAYLVDPLSISGDEIKKFLESKNLVKLFYGADSDVSLVYKQYGIKIRSLLDLKHLVDVLDLPGKGLGTVLQEVLGLEVASKGKFQMHNWMHRPIDPAALEYALGDVKHLFALKEALMSRIFAQGLGEKLVTHIIQNEKTWDYDPVPRILRSPEFQALSPKAQDRFRTIYAWREEKAKDRNCPPDKVLRKDALFTLAAKPDTARGLKPDRELTYGFIGELQGLLKG